MRTGFIQLDSRWLLRLLVFILVLFDSLSFLSLLLFVPIHSAEPPRVLLDDRHLLRRRYPRISPRGGVPVRFASIRCTSLHSARPLHPAAISYTYRRRGILLLLRCMRRFYSICSRKSSFIFACCGARRACTQIPFLSEVILIIGLVPLASTDSSEGQFKPV